MYVCELLMFSAVNHMPLKILYNLAMTEIEQKSHLMKTNCNTINPEACIVVLGGP